MASTLMNTDNNELGVPGATHIEGSPSPMLVQDDILHYQHQLPETLSAMQLQNNVSFHEFRVQVLDSMFFFQVTNFGKSIYLWVGDGGGKMNDLAMSSTTPYDRKGMPTTTKIFGCSGDNLSESFAAKLTKRLKKPVYVSFNVDLGAMYTTVLQDIEQRVYEEIALCPDKF